MKYLYNFFLVFSVSTCMVLLFSACNSGSQKKDSTESEEDVIESVPMDDQLEQNFNKSKLILYSLPSPLETAMLIKRSGGEFDRGILNPIDNISRYNTNFKLALNLGVYSADLSYSSLFDQTQVTIEYMDNARKMAEQLGITGAIDEETIKKLEENMNNREVMMDIISETYMNSNSYLADNNRAAVSVMVLAGGWVEGLYLATSLADGSVESNEKLVERILYQKLSLVTLMNMMEGYRDNEDIQNLMTKMEELEAIFDKVTIVNTSEVESETDTVERMTTIRAESEISISPQDFEALCDKVEELRAEFIS